MSDSQSNFNLLFNFGNYKIDGFNINEMNVIGDGAQGTIFECTHPEMDTPLCVKIIETKSSRLLQQSREPEIIQQIKDLKHINIIKIIHIAQNIDKCYIFMERCKYDLNGHFKKNYEKKQVPANHLIDIVKQVVNGYLLLFEKEIFHRDLKTENLLVGLDGHIKITDFGLCKILGDHQLMQQRTAVCTTYYASPQILKDGIYSGKSDVFSLGVVIYKAAYKKHPYSEKEVGTNLEWMRLYDKLMDDGNLALKLPDIPGTQSEKEELYWFLKTSLALEEENRISWTDLFMKYCDGYVHQQYENMQEKELDHAFLSTGFGKFNLNKSRASSQFYNTAPTKLSDQQNQNKRLNKESQNFIDTKKDLHQFDEQTLVKLIDVLLAKADFAQTIILSLRKNKYEYVQFRFNLLIVLDYYLICYKYQIHKICFELVHSRKPGQFLKSFQLTLPQKEILRGENSLLLKKQIIQNFHKIDKEYKMATEYMKEFELFNGPANCDSIFYWKQAQSEIISWLQKQGESMFDNKNLQLFICRLIKFSKLEEEIPNSKFEETSISIISYVNQKDEQYLLYFNQIRGA